MLPSTDQNTSTIILTGEAVFQVGSNGIQEAVTQQISTPLQAVVV